MTKLTKENYPFHEFVLEKYETELAIGFEAAQEDGARYESKRQWFKDQMLEDEIIACGGDLEADQKEWESLLTTEPEVCEHHEVDFMLGCLDCGKAYHEVRDMDLDHLKE